MDSTTSSRVASKTETSQLPIPSAGIPIRTLSKLYLDSLISILSKLPSDRLVRILSILYLTDPSKLASKALVVQVETEYTRPVSDTETSRLFILPYEILARILKFLDTRTLLLVIPRVCKHLYQSCGLYSNCALYFGHPMGYLYGTLIFSRGGPIAQLTPENDFRPEYFQPNVKLLLEGITQPEGMHVHVVTRSNSKEIRLKEIISMTIKPSAFYCRSDNFGLGIEPFLRKLLKSELPNLKYFKLTGFKMNGTLWDCLSLLDLRQIHYSPFHAGGYFSDSDRFPKPKLLHMYLRESFNLCRFPKLPPRLKGLSLHISNPCHNEDYVDISHCEDLKRM